MVRWKTPKTTNSARKHEMKKSGFLGDHFRVYLSCVVSSNKMDIKQRTRVLYSGLMTALGITLHNFPEGVSIFLASMKSTAMGVTLAVAIALHNIPEGVAVALPVYFATKSRWEGFKYAALSGLAEPLAVILLGFVFQVLFAANRLLPGWDLQQMIVE